MSIEFWNVGLPPAKSTERSLISLYLSSLGPDEVQELNRQNRITEQILTNFFERKFFPNRKPRPAPTIDEILPPEQRLPNKQSLKERGGGGDDDEPETDNLQSVESEHVDSFYRDYEGRWNISFSFCLFAFDFGLVVDFVFARQQ